MALNLRKAVSEFLREKAEEKFTAREIATEILKRYPQECQEKKARSTARVIPIISDADLVQQLVAEIGAQRTLIQDKTPEIKTTESRPRKYYFSAKSDAAEVESAEDESPKQGAANQSYSEHSLYPKLAEFLWYELNIYAKRIDEKRSKNSHGSGGNRWLFPDLVGLEDLSKDWHVEIKHAVQEVSERKTRLWSFEVKKFINRSNVREVYFQAVSNSSWAHFGYLVVSEIQGAETIKELRLLSGLHGIGVIELDIESPTDSQILIPARQKNDIDWNVANRLAEENADFLIYIKLLRQFYQTGEHRLGDWDIPKETE
ncbi:MAG TPA: HrgA protein [Alphaproteobacteria bacterium]|nr:HrgA protein [Alphaproteobacteria bacterium]